MILIYAYWLTQSEEWLCKPSFWLKRSNPVLGVIICIQDNINPNPITHEVHRGDLAPRYMNPKWNLDQQRLYELSLEERSHPQMAAAKLRNHHRHSSLRRQTAPLPCRRWGYLLMAFKSPYGIFRRWWREKDMERHLCRRCMILTHLGISNERYTKPVAGYTESISGKKLEELE